MVARKGALQFGIRAKVSTLSLDGPVERSLDRECEGKFGLEGQFRTLVCSKVSRSYLTSFKLRRYSSVMKPQPVWYKSTGREESTPKVQKL